MERRTQAERLSIVEALLTGVNEEIFKGKAEDILQIAVNCQVEINRMVWKLNKVRCDDGGEDL